MVWNQLVEWGPLHGKSASKLLQTRRTHGDRDFALSLLSDDQERAMAEIQGGRGLASGACVPKEVSVRRTRQEEKRAY